MKFFEIFHRDGQNGDSGRTRTPNLLIRSQLLYPVELRNQFDNATGCAGFYPICPDAFCQYPNAAVIKVIPKDAYFDDGHENRFGLWVRLMRPGTIAGKGKIISIGTRLDAP